MTPTEKAARITHKMVSALKLLADNPAISADDRQVDKYSGDGEPDTWNKLFDAGLAVQSGPGFSGDDYWLSITPAGEAALKARP